MKTESRNYGGPGGIELDWSTMKALESSLARLSQAMIEDAEPRVQKVGVYLKNESIGFVAAMADCERQGFKPGDVMNSALNTYAHLLTFLIMRISGDLETAEHNATKMLRGLTKAIEHMVRVNMSDARNHYTSATRH